MAHQNRATQRLFHIHIFEDIMNQHPIIVFAAALFLILGAAEAQAVTLCDELASHPDDPDKVAPGVEREDI